MIRMLVVTTLFPNSMQLRHGIFVATRLRQLLQSGEVTAEVIAPVPWFPFKQVRFGQYSKFAQVPRVEQLDGITIHHPRYLVVPKIGMLFTPFTLAVAIWRQLRELQGAGKSFDLIDAHYFYPDGVSAAMVSKLCSMPCFITARGSDINLIGPMALPGRMIRWAAGQATACIAVCQALKDRMVQLGILEGSITVLRNGVDTKLFYPSKSGKQSSVSAHKTLLSVGNLVQLKGHDLVIKALVHLPNCYLKIVGGGPERQNLETLAVALDVEDRVQFVGTVSQTDLVKLYQAADALVLASSSEGMANVLLECIACGTPVVTTDVGGAKEVVIQKEIGCVLDSRTPQAIAQGVQRVLMSPLNTSSIEQFVDEFAWKETVRKLLTLIKKKIQSEVLAT